GGASRGSARVRARELLRAVRIAAPALRMREYPHQMSGGMRQRIVGAIAISCEPRLLIADEPTTSLDVTIQAQYLNLLRDLQRARHLAMIFITHNLGIVAKMCDRVAVMYAGRMVEAGPARPRGRRRARRGRRLVRGRARPDPRRRRRVGVRQDDDRKARAASRSAHVGRDPLRGPGSPGVRRGSAARVPPVRAGRLPGPLRLAQSADARLLD